MRPFFLGLTPLPQSQLLPGATLLQYAFGGRAGATPPLGSMNATLPEHWVCTLNSNPVDYCPRRRKRGRHQNIASRGVLVSHRTARDKTSDRSVHGRLNMATLLFSSKSAVLHGEPRVLVRGDKARHQGAIFSLLNNQAGYRNRAVLPSSFKTCSGHGRWSVRMRPVSAPVLPRSSLKTCSGLALHEAIQSASSGLLRSSLMTC